jgi:hypothetical protein
MTKMSVKIGQPNDSDGLMRRKRRNAATEGEKEGRFGEIMQRGLAKQHHWTDMRTASSPLSKPSQSTLI